MPTSTPAQARPTLVSVQASRRPRSRGGTRFDAPPWIWGVALALPLAVAYLVVAPPSGDLAAAAYRSQLFARAGFVVWDNGWYAGHALPAYSLLAPALGAALGVRELLALSAVLAAALFGVLAARALPTGPARAATLAFAFGFCAELPSGRVPYDLGVAVAVAALLATSSATGGSRQWPALTIAVALAVATSVASPVAGAFLALVALALALSATAVDGATSARILRATPPIAVCAAALLPILALSLAFPEGGYEPFAAGAFWPELAAALAFAALLPRGALSANAWRTLRIGAILYALALVASFLVKTPMGGNAVRLGALFGTPLVVAALWDSEVSIGARRGGGRAAAMRPLRRRALGRRVLGGRTLLLLLAPALLYWQLASAIDDQVSLAGDQTVKASFYAPLRKELLRLAAGRASGHEAGRHGAGGADASGDRAGGNPIRVEVPLTGAHWESAFLPSGEISIARGWERQLDTRYDALFYRRGLTATAYRRWLDANAISYVALPNARLDEAGRQEARLIEARPPLPYLREVWRSRHWRLLQVLHPTPLAQPPARMLSVGVDSFSLLAPRAGSYEVRLHWSPYWVPTGPIPARRVPIHLSAHPPARPLRSGRTCVSRAPDGFTRVSTAGAGVVRVGVAFSLSRVFSEAPRCAH